MKSPKEIVKPKRCRKKTHDKAGQPTKYNKEIADEICRTIAKSKIGIRRLCEMHPHWPCPETIINWKFDSSEFFQQYTKAKQIQVETLVDDTYDIAMDQSRDILTDNLGKETGNGTAVARDRLIIDTIKWNAGKVAPKIYGEAKKEIVFEKQNLSDMDLEDRINQIESLSLDEQRELFGIVAKKIKESKGNK